MMMHDHEKKSDQEEWCPLMQDVCRAGFTEKMGVDPITKKNRKCKAWQPVTVNDPRANPPLRDVHDCSIFGWAPDLMVQVANEVYHGAKATEEVRNRVAQSTGALRVVQSFFMQLARAAGHTLELPAADEKQNGQGGDHG